MTNPDKTKIFKHIAWQKKMQSRRKDFLYKVLLEKYNVVARDDSRLCRKYIFGENINIATIADMLKETDWYHKNTPYHQTNTEMQQCHKDHCRRDLDPFVIKDLFSAIAKAVCDEVDQARCRPGFCLIYGDTTFFDKNITTINNFCMIPHGAPY